MKKYISLLLSLLLLSMTLLPCVYAEEIVAETEQSEAASTVQDATASQDAPASQEKAVKTAEDYEDVKVLPPEIKEAFDFFIRAGAIKPQSETVLGINRVLTKQDFIDVAKVAFTTPPSKAVGDEGTTTVKRTTIEERIYQLGITNREGYVYEPNGKVNRESLAKYLIYGIDMVDFARKAEIIIDDSINNFDSVSQAIRRFVSVCITKGLMSRQDDGYFNGDREANLLMLVQGAFQGKLLYERMNDTSILTMLEAIPVGARRVQIKFNHPVNKEIAELNITKDGYRVVGSTEWSQDNASAIIVLEKKLTSGAYVAAISGYDEKSINVKSLEFIAEDEKFDKLVFANDSDYLPRSKVLVQFKLTNQYGETSEQLASHFSIDISRNHFPEYAAIDQGFQIDLSEEKRNARILITIEEEDLHIRLSKSFIVSDVAVVSKIELGDLIYEESTTYLEPGKRAYLSFAAYDQYGYRVVDTDRLGNDLLKMFQGNNIFKESRKNVFEDKNNDGYPEMVFEADDDLEENDSTTVHFVATGSGQSASKVISVFAPKKPAIIVFSDPNIFADEDTNKTVGFKVRDSEGYDFSADEVVALVTANKLKVRSNGRITLGVSDPTTSTDSGAIPITGAARGSNIRIANVTGEGKAVIEAELVDVNHIATQELTLRPKREVKKVLVDTHIAKVLPTKKKDINFNFYDQYETDFSSTDYKVEYKLERLSGDAGAFTTATINLNDKTPVVIKNLSTSTSQGVSVVAAANKSGIYRVTATLINPDNARVSSASFTAESVKAADLQDELKYSIDLSSSTSMFAFGKYTIDSDWMEKSTSEERDRKAGEKEGEYLFNNRNGLYSTYQLKALDKYGVDVSLTGDFQILSIKPLDPEIIYFKPGKLIGLNPGTTKILTTINSAGKIRSFETDVSVNYSQLIAKPDSLKTQNKDNMNINKSQLNGRYIWESQNGPLLGWVQISDESGNTFRNVSDFGKPNDTSKTFQNLTPVMDIMAVSFELGDVTHSTTDITKQDTFYMTDEYKLVYEQKGSTPTLKNFRLTVKGPANKKIDAIFTVLNK